MKYNRRSFIALAAVMSAGQSYGNKSVQFFKPSQNSSVQRFKKLFELKSHFLPSELSNTFRKEFNSFKNLGYKNQFKGCLLNHDKTYAICPLVIPGSLGKVQEIFLMFTKDAHWSFVGSFNQYESELFLAISEKLQSAHRDFQTPKMLPKKRIINGLDNPFCAENNTFSFRVVLNDGILEGRVTNKNVSIGEESMKMNFRS